MKKIEFDVENHLIYFDGELLPFAEVTSIPLGEGQFYGSGIYSGDIKNKLKQKKLDQTDWQPRVHLVIDDLPEDLSKYLIIETDAFSLELWQDLKYMQGIDMEKEMESICRMTSFRFPLTEEGEYAKRQFILYYKQLFAQAELENIKRDFD